MATSTFGKQFSVTQESTREFVEEMTQAVTPTLQKEFQSNLVYLVQDKDLKNSFIEVLNKK